MDRHLLYHDMLESLAHDQCPVCRLTERRIDRLIRVMLREGVGDGETLRRCVRAKGFCNAHAWRMKEAGDPAAQAAFYRSLLEQHRASLERHLQRRKALGGVFAGVGAAADGGAGRGGEAPGSAGAGGAGGEGAARGGSAGGVFARFRTLSGAAVAVRRRIEEAERRRFLDSFSSEARCPLCVAAEASERMYVAAAVDYFAADEEFRERYRNRGVLCHPHVRRLVEEHGHRDEVTEMLDIQLVRLERHIDQLRELERTSAVRWSDEAGAPHLGGWIRAVRLDVGAPGTDTRYKTRVPPIPFATLKP